MQAADRGNRLHELTNRIFGRNWITFIQVPIGSCQHFVGFGLLDASNERASTDAFGFSGTANGELLEFGLGFEQPNDVELRPFERSDIGIDQSPPCKADLCRSWDTVQ